MRPSDRDLVDVILGDAPSGVQDKVREAVSADPEVSSRYAKWSGLITASREGRSAAALHGDIVESTMARLKASDLMGVDGLKSLAHTKPSSANLHRHWYPLRTMAAAGLILLGVSVYFLNSPESPSPNAGPSSEPAQVVNNLDPLETYTLHVDFAARHTGDGTSASPFSSLSDAVMRSPSDAILKIAAGSTPETLRLEKRLRIEAVNGKVQIGAS